MLKTRSEKIVFGILMSVTMAIGMEVYNVAIKMGYKVGKSYCNRGKEYSITYLNRCESSGTVPLKPR